MGKSTLMNKMMRRDFKGDYEPTIGVDFGSFSMKINNKTVKLQIWDTVTRAPLTLSATHPPRIFKGRTGGLHFDHSYFLPRRTVRVPRLRGRQVSRLQCYLTGAGERRSNTWQGGSVKLRKTRTLTCYITWSGQKRISKNLSKHI